MDVLLDMTASCSGVRPVTWCRSFRPACDRGLQGAAIKARPCGCQPHRS